jgi:hypothetical protein
MEGDDELFISCVSFPLLQETINGQRLILSRDEIYQTLSRVRHYMKVNDIVDLVRTVTSAEFVDSDTISSTHVSLMLRRDERIERSPYPVHSVIRRYGASWRLISSIYAILDSPERNSALIPGKLLSAN